MINKVGRDESTAFIADKIVSKRPLKGIGMVPSTGATTRAVALSSKVTDAGSERRVKASMNVKDLSLDGDARVTP